MAGATKKRALLLDGSNALSVGRLHRQVVQSIETSALHLDLIGDMKRLNSMFCSSAYAVLEAGESGALNAEETGGE
jgi:phosphate:Na+ symporter